MRTLTEIQTFEQLMESRLSPEPAAGVTLPPEVLTQVVHESLDKHYRATLDQPVGMLGGRTPRACARSKAGRDKVVEWLKYLERENSRPGRDEGDPMRSYDFNWLWDETRRGRSSTLTDDRFQCLPCPASRSRALAERTVQAPAPRVVRPAEQNVQRYRSQDIASVGRARHRWRHEAQSRYGASHPGYACFACPQGCRGRLA